MIYHWEIEQNTEEWMALRKGRFTASSIPKLFSGKSTQGYNDTIYKIASERRYGITPQGFSNKWTDRGHELEDAALFDYSLENDVIVKKVGFVEVDEWLGCSPDGLIGEKGMVQAKCLKWNTHLSYLLGDKVDKDYFIQCQVELWMTGRDWNDLIGFHPDYPTKTTRIYPDEKIFKDIETEVRIAKERVLELIEKPKEYGR